MGKENIEYWIEKLNVDTYTIQWRVEKWISENVAARKQFYQIYFDLQINH